MARISDKELSKRKWYLDEWTRKGFGEKMVSIDWIGELVFDLQDARNELKKNEPVKGDNTEEFDVSKVKTCLNADDVKIGATGIFADTLKELKDFIKQNIVNTVKRIQGEKDIYRFGTISNNYALFYPLEQKKPSLRGYLQELANKHKVYFRSEPNIGQDEIVFYLDECETTNAEYFFNIKLRDLKDDLNYGDIISPK